MTQQPFLFRTKYAWELSHPYTYYNFIRIINENIVYRKEDLFIFTNVFMKKPLVFGQVKAERLIPSYEIAIL